MNTPARFSGLAEHAQEMYAWRATYALLERIALAAKAVKK